MVSAQGLFLPPQLRQQQGIRRTVLDLVLSLVFWICLQFSYNGALTITGKMTDYQWLPGGLGLLLLREICSCLVRRYACRAAGQDDFVARIIPSHLVSCTSALGVAIFMGSSATNETTWLLLLADFATNLYLCHKASRLLDSGENEKALDALVTMVLNESLEVLLPLAFLASFCMLWHSPNAEHFGNLKADIWHYKPLMDENTMIISTLRMIVVDATSLLLSSAYLWKKHKISTWQMFIFLQRNYGGVFAAQQSFLMENWYCLLSTLCVADMTFQFSWLPR